MSLRIFTLALGCALLLTAPAQAQPRIQPGGGGGGGGGAPQPAQPAGLLQATNAEATAEALKAAGYTDIEFVTLNDAKQVQAKVNGVVMRVYHYSCENNACRSIQFYTSFGRQQQIDTNYVNAWNRDKRFAKLYVEANGSLSFDMDVHLYGGVGPQYIAQSAALFGQLLKILFEYKPAAN